MINIGIDVHKRLCVAAVKGDTAELLGREEFHNAPDTIRSFAKRIKHKYAGQTAGPARGATGNYRLMLHDILEDHGIDTLLARPSMIKAIAQAKLKDDKTGSSVLADLLGTGMACESFVPDKRHRNLRALPGARIGMARATTREKNKITATPAEYDSKSPTKDKFGKKGIEALRNADVSKVDRMTPGAQLEMIETVTKHRDAFEREIAATCGGDPRAKLLMTIPGISHLTALGILSEIADARGFKTAEKLAAYAGVVPSRRNSGDAVRGGGITRTGSTWLRYALVNEATTAVRHDEGIKGICERISKRRGKPKAKVAVDRMLAMVIWHMPTNGTEYKTQNEGLTYEVSGPLSTGVNLVQRSRFHACD